MIVKYFNHLQHWYLSSFSVLCCQRHQKPSHIPKY